MTRSRRTRVLGVLMLLLSALAAVLLYARSVPGDLAHDLAIGLTSWCGGVLAAWLLLDRDRDLLE